MNLVAEKRVGVITNHSARIASGVHLVDELLRRGVRVTALFGPEHGIRGEEAAGRHVRDTVDVLTGLPVYSLYGATRAPTPAMLETVDVLVYDIQDVGVRFYTYISTMVLSHGGRCRAGDPGSSSWTGQIRWGVCSSTVPCFRTPSVHSSVRSPFPSSTD